jgi:hypothetical protein
MNNAVAREARDRVDTANKQALDRAQHEFFATHTKLDAWAAKVESIDAGPGNTVIATFELSPTGCSLWPNLVIAVRRADQAAVQYLGSLKQGDFVTVAGSVQAIGWRGAGDAPAYVALREPVISNSSDQTMKATITNDNEIPQALDQGGKKVTEDLQRLEDEISARNFQRAMDFVRH